MEQYNMPIRILCVDDERNVLRALERVFLDDDYEIVTAGSGDEAFGIMKESGDSFQVVVSDYRMPVMNGVEFLKQVFISWPDTVRIVLSGYADAGAIVAAINEGHIYKFIPKPWNDEELRITIQNCLERYFLLRRNRELIEQLAIANQELELKVQQRTEELEIRNRAMEFSQTMLAALPVGVVGIDENDLIVTCNKIGSEILGALCRDFFGTEVRHFCDRRLQEMVEKVKSEKNIDIIDYFKDRRWRVIGRSVMFAGTKSTVFVFLEV